jgi:hypothetical protein
LVDHLVCEEAGEHAQVRAGFRAGGRAAFNRNCWRELGKELLTKGAHELVPSPGSATREHRESLRVRC